jgi:hypothetical protein
MDQCRHFAKTLQELDIPFDYGPESQHQSEHIEEATRHSLVYDPTGNSAWAIIPSLCLAVDTVANRGFLLEIYTDNENECIVSVEFAVGYFKQASNNYSPADFKESHEWVLGYFNEIVAKEGFYEMHANVVKAIQARAEIQSRPAGGVLQSTVQGLLVLKGQVCTFCVESGSDCTRDANGRDGSWDPVGSSGIQWRRAFNARTLGTFFRDGNWVGWGLLLTHFSH